MFVRAWVRSPQTASFSFGKNGKRGLEPPPCEKKKKPACLNKKTAGRGDRTPDLPLTKRLPCHLAIPADNEFSRSTIFAFFSFSRHQSSQIIRMVNPQITKTLCTVEISATVGRKAVFGLRVINQETPKLRKRGSCQKKTLSLIA